MIVYSVICRAKDSAVLAEQSSEALSGNAAQVAIALLTHLASNPSAVQEGDLKTFVHRNEKGGWAGDDFFSQFMQACTIPVTTTEELDLGAVQEHYFHLWYQDSVFYCCLSDNPDPKKQKVYFAFLQAVARDFTAKYSARRIRNCNAYALDKDFCPTLRSSMHYYNINSETLSRDQKINALMGQVEDMKSVLGRNIELMLERETKLDALLEKTEQTKKDSLVFKKKAKQVKKQYRGRSCKLWFLIAGILFLVVYTLITAACGISFQRCVAQGGKD